MTSALISNRRDLACITQILILIVGTSCSVNDNEATVVGRDHNVTSHQRDVNSTSSIPHSYSKNGTSNHRTLDADVNNASELASKHSSKLKVSPPKLNSFGFFNAPTSWPSGTPMPGAGVHTSSKHTALHSNNMDIWVSLLGIGCFLCGMLVTTFLAILIYRRQRSKWRSKARRHCDSGESIKTLRQPCGDFFRFKEGVVGHADICTLIPSVPLDVGNGWTPNTTASCLMHQFTSFRGSSRPFVFQMSQPITHNACDIMDEHSDVTVTVPQGALPQGKTRQMFVNIALSGGDLNLATSKTFVQLSPVVEVLCLGVKRFARPVTLKVPHRARITPGCTWRLIVLQSGSNLGDSATWRAVLEQVNGPREGPLPDSFYTYDDQFIYIHSYVPSAFACMGAPNKKTVLKLCAMVFAKWQHGKNENINDSDNKTVVSPAICDNDNFSDNASFDLTMTPTTSRQVTEPNDASHISQRSFEFSDIEENLIQDNLTISSEGDNLEFLGKHQSGIEDHVTSTCTHMTSQPHVALRVFICDNYIDVIKHVEGISRQGGWQRVSHAQSLAVYNQRDMQVALHDMADNTWPWTLYPGDDKSQTVPMMSCVTSPAAPPSVDFRLIPRDSNRGPAEGIQACFDIAQQRKHANKVLSTSVITTVINVKELCGEGSSSIKRLAAT